MKRIFYLLGILALIGGIVGIGAFLRYRSESAKRSAPAAAPRLPSATTNNPAEPGTTTESASRQIADFGVVSQYQALNYHIGDDNTVTLIQPDGRMVSIRNGVPFTISSSTIASLQRAEFSVGGEYVLVTTRGQSGPQTTLFDVAARAWQALPGEVQSAAWSSVKNDIAYIGASAAGPLSLQTLDIANPRAKPIVLAQFQAQDIRMSWPTPQYLVLTEGASAAYRNSVWKFDTTAKSFEEIVIDRPGAASVWNREVDRGLVLISGPRGTGGELSLVDGRGSILRKMRVFTLPSKCIFESAGQPAQSISTSSPATTTPVTGPQDPSIVCAIPRDAEALRRHPLPDAYERREVFTVDDFYRINLRTGDIALLYGNGEKYIDATNLKIKLNRLFFVNRYDNKLYAITLQ